MYAYKPSLKLLKHWKDAKIYMNAITHIRKSQQYFLQKNAVLKDFSLCLFVFFFKKKEQEKIVKFRPCL